MLKAATLALVALVALALVAPASAGADAFSFDGARGHYAGERDALSNPTVAAAVAFGARWLADHGRTECATAPGGSFRMAPDLGRATTAVALGRALGCDAWVRTGDVAKANTQDRIWLASLAETVVHELAHTAGMSHADMASSGLEAAWRVACARWAVRVAGAAGSRSRAARAWRDGSSWRVVAR